MLPWSTRALLALFFATSLVAATSTRSKAEVGTTVCLSNGTKIVASSFETHDGKFFFTVPGASAPLSYPAEMVVAINVPECPAAKVSNPPKQEDQTPGRFGVHGSNTIGERLMPMLIDAFSQQRLGALPTRNATKPEESEITLPAAVSGARVIDFQSHGSGTSAKGLLSGAALIGMSSRRANEAEQKDISVRYSTDIWAPDNEHVLALDGLAVIVNPANPIKSLDLKQIAQIFSGQITNWSDVGGASGPIRVLRRDDRSGTFDTFKNLVLEPEKLTIASNAQRFESSDSLSDEVYKDVNAIGFIGLPYVNNNTALRLASTCGLNQSATRFAIKSEQYPLARRLYLYTIGAPSDPTARDLLSFVLSDAAQPTISEGGFIDQSIEFQDRGEQNAWVDKITSDPMTGLDPNAQVPRNSVRAFTNVLGAAQRASIMFRFDKASSQLDTRAKQDVKRLARYLSARNAGKVYLVGFADARGSWRRNLDLAAERAAMVARELANEHVNIPRKNLFALSYLAPVACNDTELGMTKNRRVEVWIERD